ncbi:uncharacterized protein LOC122659241 [Telopea speciosissima]|uniref:uncharacterized protein LOC122659241 n=1 Tax=Telopea speciosissima TaxID=54955 RepID=UPI001CC48275|nr:uncharacterized protein LOC122659241 [Telopea speciosissima]
MGAHVRRTPEQVVNERHNSSSTQTTIENRFRTPEQKAKVDYHIAKWMYQQEGTYFMGFVDASGMVQSAQMLFELLDSKIDEIGEDYVIQVVTDNASNYKLAGKMLMEKRRKLHTRLDAMKKRTGQKDLVRAAVTRFATACLTCQSLVKHKDALKHLFISDEWKGSNLSKTEAGKKVEETVFAVPFWNTVEDFIRALKPLIVVLRIVDGDERPAMAEVYVAMEEAKKKIREHLAHKERLWKKIINIIDRRWECQMERPLYGAALFLNPGKFFMFKESEDGELIANLHISLIDVMTRLVDDPAIQDKITLQIDDYRFSMVCTYFVCYYVYDVLLLIQFFYYIFIVTWWSTNGGRAFELSKLARRILGLCCSSSSCKRNWSTFEFIHTKKRNRLEHSRLNDLVYVQYNSRLQERFQQRRELEGKNKKYDPLILDELDWSSEWMVTQPVEDLVHPNDDLTWDDVGRAMGASIEAPIRPRRTQASTSRVNVTYSRRGYGRGRGSSRMVNVQDDSEPYEDEEEEEDDVNDDKNVVDDYDGVEEPRQENLPNADLLDEYDN